jgi:hypothetical protein
LLLIGLLAFHNLCEDFFQNERLAIAATLLQFTFFVLLQELRQPGSTFFFRLSEDKAFAAFILAPVFFLAMRHFLSSFTWRNGAFVLFSGLSLTVTHPVILAYSLIIASLYVSVLCLITERNLKKLGISMLLLIVIVLPAMSLRFIDGPLTSRFVVNLQSAIDAYSEDSGGRFSYIEGTPFYGFDLERLKIKITEPDQETPLQTFFSWSCLWLLIIGFFWSLFHLKKRATAPFVFATTALVLLCGIPYTGWLIGYLVSAGMLWRAPWLLPIGLISLVLINEVVKAVSHKMSAQIEPHPVRERALLWLFSAICIVLMAYASIPRYNAMKRAILSRDMYVNRLERLSRLGNHLENNIEQSSVFVAPMDIISFLPGLSSKADIIFFRTRHFTPHPVDPAKLKLIFSPDASVQMRRRMNVLKRYQIQYVLITDRSLMNYYASYTKFFDIQEANGFWILELQDSNS